MAEQGPSGVKIVVQHEFADGETLLVTATVDLFYPDAVLECVTAARVAFDDAFKRVRDVEGTDEDVVPFDPLLLFDPPPEDVV